MDLHVVLQLACSSVPHTNHTLPASPHVVLCALLQLLLIVQQDCIDPAGMRLQAGQEHETAFLGACP